MRQQAPARGEAAVVIYPADHADERDGDCQRERFDTWQHEQKRRRDRDDDGPTPVGFGNDIPAFMLIPTGI